MELYPWQEALMKMWTDIKNAIANIANIQVKIEKERKLRSTWIVNTDTRIRSQVTNNKPRHLVRKIIR